MVDSSVTRADGLRAFHSISNELLPESAKDCVLERSGYRVHLAEQLSRHAGSRDTRERSLYPYFFSTLDAPMDSQRKDCDESMLLAA